MVSALAFLNSFLVTNSKCKRAGVLPVKMLARAAEQIGAGEYASVMRIPSAARRSRWGVLCHGCP